MPEQSLTLEDLTKLSENLFEIAKTHRYDMRVPARICANKDFLEDILKDKSLEQLINVTTLPGIQDFAIAMPDIHQGYGFPIGGVAAMDLDEGVISPGGIGYDINCGMRLLMTSLRAGDVTEKLAQLADELYAAIPSGVGKGGQHTYTPAELDQILQNGAEYMFKHGLGTAEDLVVCEENGRLTSADSTCVSPEAKKRGMDQLGTLGSGNHFLEVQRVETVFNEHIARNFGLFQDQIVCMIHCGSRGLGHQICTDYVRTMIPKLADWNIILPDRELACAPFKSVEGQQYFKAMACAANFAWANRHVIGHHVREVMHRIFGIHTMVQTLYDVSHNIGKIESHTISGKQKIVLVHRKGATRAFGPGHPALPPIYQKTGQPVLIPGTMGTASYVLAGTNTAMNLSFGSTCHGAGRRLSRIAATKLTSGSVVRKKLHELGILVRCRSNRGLAEEAPLAYKDIDNVVNIVNNLGIAQKIVRLVPVVVIKG